MSKKYSVGLIGATGMVGRRFAEILENHPWFDVKAVASSSRSAGKTYEEAISGRGLNINCIPKSMKNLIIYDAEKDLNKIAQSVDFVFCAVNMKKDQISAFEEACAKAECPVVSNNSAHRLTKDVPMIIPEINPDHTEIIVSQKKRLGTKRGFIAVKSNCSIQSYVPALHPLLDLGLKKAAVCTYQAISGAGKTFETWPEMADNVIPYIGGEEEKSEKEPLKVWGHISGDEIVSNNSIEISAQCIRVPVSDGHMAAVFASFDKQAENDEIISRWENFKTLPQKLMLPSSPKKFLHYFSEPDRPQTKLDRKAENGMGISIGRLRKDNIFDVKFVSLSHNTLRGAAGGAVLLAELLCSKGYI